MKRKSHSLAIATLAAGLLACLILALAAWATTPAVPRVVPVAATTAGSRVETPQRQGEPQAEKLPEATRVERDSAQAERELLRNHPELNLQLE
jgi:hypothetical protein